MLLTVTLAFAAYVRSTCRFGWEQFSLEEENPEAFIHQQLTRRVCADVWAGREGEMSAAKALAWHTDYIDSYLYSPLFWAGGLTSGDGLDRLKVSTSLRAELESVHFDDLTSVDQIEAMWTRYLSGCLAGLLWAADRNDVPAAHNILGTTLHAIQDFYAHSSWVDDENRRDTPWHEIPLLERSEMNLYTGSYETGEHLSQRPHGKTSLECSLMRASGLGPVMSIACAGISPMNKLTPCQIYDRCLDAQTVRTNVLGVQLPAGLVYLDPPGIALDSSWQAEIARQVREIPPDDPVTGTELYEKAKDLAVRTSVWWFQEIGQVMDRDDRLREYWKRVLTTDTFGSRRAQFEDFSRLPLLFVASGPYPPRHDDTDWDWYLRLQIRTSSETDSGTNGTVRVSADGQPPFVLDYGALSSAVVEYNDFSTGDVQTYVVGPLRELPRSLTFSVEGRDVGDILGVIWEGFVAAITGLVDALGDFVLSLIGGHADFVAQRKLQWSPEELAHIGSTPVPFREFLDGDDEGQYNVYGSIQRIRNDRAPRRHSTFSVRIDRIECWEESTEFSGSDEPFLLAVLVNLAEREGGKRVDRFRTSPASMDDGDSHGINHAFEATVPDGWGMLALALAVYESDQESAAARDALLAKFAGDAEVKTRSWSDKLVETVGATFGSDWKVGGLEVYAFNRAPVFAGAATLFKGAVEQWIDAGSSRTFPLITEPEWTTWSLPPLYATNRLITFSLRAERLFQEQRFEETEAEARHGIAAFAPISRRHPEIPLTEHLQTAETWVNHAARAHPRDVPRQLAAAAVCWEINSFLGDRPLPDPRLDDAEVRRVITMLRRLVGLATFGAPDSSRSIQAADLAIRIYQQLTDREYKHDIAMCLSDLALRQHETAFHPQCPDRDGELARQRATAHRSLELAETVVAGLPDPSITQLELYQLAVALRRVVGTVTFGANDSALSGRAAELAVRIFDQLTERDSRLDIGETWHGLSLRHHEIGAREDCPDKPAEFAKQREIAQRSAGILVPLVDDLPHPAYGTGELQQMVSVLDRVAGLLTFGAPADDPALPELNAVAERTRAAAKRVRQLLGD